MNPAEKKKNIYIFVAVCSAFLSVMAVLIVLMIKGGPPNSPATSESSGDSQPTSTQPASSESQSASGSIQNGAPEFTLLESKAPTWQGVNAYAVGDSASVQSTCNETSRLEGVTTFTGHQVYQIEDDGESKYIILYGTDIQFVDAKGWMPNLAFCRKEWSGERIYVLDTQREVDEYTKAWQAGQDILSGKEKAEKGAIIVNGRLISGYQFVERDGEIYVPLTPIARAIDPWSFDENSEGKYIQFSVYRPDGYECLMVPYEQTQVGSYHFESQKFSSGNFLEEYGEVWNDMFRYGDGGSLCYVPVSELSRYTGWYIYSSGDIVSIKSSELDVTSNFVLNTQGSQSLEEQLKRGDSAEITVDNDFYLENKEEIDRLTEEILAQNDK